MVRRIESSEIWRLIVWNGRANNEKRTNEKRKRTENGVLRSYQSGKSDPLAIVLFSSGISGWGKKLGGKA